MKATEAERPTGRSSDRRPTPTVESIALSGPSQKLDPTVHAYRRDLADVSLAGRVIASHFADPVKRSIMGSAQLRSSPSQEAEALGELGAGEPFWLLEESLGWAWGYGGTDRRVGYVRSEMLAKA